ncbi:MAG: ACT domain-containing protein [Thermodesulfobacteriota bacterium]
MEKIKVGGLMQSDGRALLRVLSATNLMDAPGIILAALAGRGINVELLVEAVDLEDAANFSLVVAQKDLELALVALEGLKAEVEARGITYLPDVSVLSIFGPHLREKPKIPGIMFTSLASAGVAVLAISTSISSISCVVEGRQLGQALEVLCERFDLPYKTLQRPKNW